MEAGQIECVIIDLSRGGGGRKSCFRLDHDNQISRQEDSVYSLTDAGNWIFEKNAPRNGVRKLLHEPLRRILQMGQLEFPGKQRLRF